MALLGLCLLLLFSLSTQKVIPHEPMSIVKSFLYQPSQEQLFLWQPLTKSTGSHREKLVSDMTNHLKHLVKFKSFVLSLDGDPIIELFPSGMFWNTTHSLPNPNIVTFLSTSLSILLEDHEPDVLYKPLVKLVKGKDVVVPKSYRSKTLIELITKLPVGYDMNTKSFLVEYETRSYVIVQVINSLLGKSLSDVWNDAFMSLQMDKGVVTDERKYTALFNDLHRLTEVVQSDLTSLPSYPLNDIPYDRSKHYAFGWWLNGDHEGACLLDVLPSDAIFSFSPNVQIFVIPSLRISAVMVNNPVTSWNEKTVGEILLEDNEIWRQLLLAVNPVYHDQYHQFHNIKKEKEEEVKRSETESSKESDYSFTGILYMVFSLFKGIWNYFLLYLDFAASLTLYVRILLWILFLVIGHVVVFWGCFVFWKVFTSISSRAHESRPKSGKDD